MSRRTSLLTVLLIACAGVFAHTQPRHVFDVASVKPCDPSIGVYPNVPSAGARFYRGCTSATSLISFAYDLPSSRIDAIPDWVFTERYTIDARPGRAVQVDEMRAMARHLLADRFAFRAHTSSREATGYHLVLARRDGALGPKVRRAAVDCMPFLSGVRSRAEVPRDAAGRDLCPPVDTATANNLMLNHRWNGMTLAFLVSTLERRVGPYVIDRTGLEGLYDFDLTWPAEDRDTPADVPQVAGAQTFLAAIEQQLGLRLEPAKVTVDVLIVDAMQRPTPD